LLLLYVVNQSLCFWMSQPVAWIYHQEDRCGMCLKSISRTELLF
jgi:hypothetical protein